MTQQREYIVTATWLVEVLSQQCGRQAWHAYGKHACGCYLLRALHTIRCMTCQIYLPEMRRQCS
jgi:hypothetical protein